MTDAPLSRLERRLLMAFLMMAAVMTLVDTTIANVALPDMQGATSSSRQEIAWVLTSYIVASAIFTPLTGWLSSRYGRKKILLWSIVGFTVASALCGLAQSLGQLVGFRLLQGICGSALVPGTQATLFDINPPEKHGKAMALFATAAITGPLIGPVAGGWLTENLSWRWVFYINLPIGLASFAGIWLFMRETKFQLEARLDLLGFSLLALMFGAFQLMLDRGQQLDWFSSPEICIELVVGATALVMFVIHSLTARHPFIDPAILADWNFVVATLIGFTLGILVYSAMALIPPMMGTLFGYPTLQVGLLMAPRGIGTLIAMLLVTRLMGRLDLRLIVCLGLTMASLSMFWMSHLSLEADSRMVVLAGIVQGFGSSTVFVPLATIGFATLPARLRNEGSALNTLIRNMGGSVGIALLEPILVHQSAAVHSRLVEGIRPDNPVAAWRMPDLDWSSVAQLARLDQLVEAQAAMVAYIDIYWLLGVVCVVSLPMAMLMRAPRRTAPVDGEALVMD